MIRTPVWPGDAPDPHVSRVPGGYLAVATASGPWQVQVLRSPDLRSWTHLGDALAGLPAWARPGRTWSPSVLARPGGWVLHYTAWHAASGRQALSVATSDRPEGPYVDTSRAPLVLQRWRGGSIDPDPFVDDDGRAWLTWKSDDNAVGRRSSLWAALLSPDGTRLAGRPVRLLRHDRPWERPLVEAPSMVRAHGRVHLLYSAGRWESAGYGVGHAVGPGPTGPFTVTTEQGPWLSGPDGPGGQSVVTGDDGEHHLAWHAWHGGVGYASGGVRALHVAALDLSGPVPRLR